MSDDPILAASGLSRRFGARVALAGFDLELSRGESLAVFGPNGAGKTTLLRVLTAALRPSAGTVRIDGKDPRQHDLEIRARIGLLSHQTFLYDDLSAIDNLLFFARLNGVAHPSDRAWEMLRAVGLHLRAEDPVRAYSRGMQQRLALARALLHDPALVFLDEPFGGLDPHAATVLRDLLQDLRRKGRSLVVTTHDLEEGLELSDRFVFLAKGRAVLEGASRGADRGALRSAYAETASERRGLRP